MYVPSEPAWCVTLPMSATSGILTNKLTSSISDLIDVCARDAVAAVADRAVAALEAVGRVAARHAAEARVGITAARHSTTTVTSAVALVTRRARAADRTRVRVAAGDGREARIVLAACRINIQMPQGEDVVSLRLQINNM